MSVLGYLKNMVVEEIPEPVPAPVAAIPKPQIVSVTPEDIDPAIRKLLEQEIQVAAHPAYSQFLTISNSMAAVIADDTTRFRATLAALAPQKVSVTDILLDVDECIQALDKKEREAAAASAKTRQTRIGAKESELKTALANRARLEQELAKCHQDCARLEAEISEETRKIADTEAQFAAAIATYRKELNERKSQISSLGKV